VELPERFRTLGPVCEHCHLSRGRKETFIVRHEDGRMVQVGRQCLRDFLGHDSPDHLVALVCLETTLRASLDAEESGGMLLGAGSGEPSIIWYLAWVIWSIQRWGWLSRRKAEGTLDMSTADRAAKACRDYAKAAREGRADRAKRPERDARGPRRTGACVGDVARRRRSTPVGLRAQPQGRVRR
jgi:hypothetical protein